MVWFESWRTAVNHVGSCSRSSASCFTPALPSASLAFFVLAGLVLGNTLAYSDCSAHQPRKAFNSRHARRAGLGRVCASLAAQASITGAVRSRSGRAISECNGMATVTPRPRVPRLAFSPPARDSFKWSA